jgi:hypothetical protein
MPKGQGKINSQKVIEGLLAGKKKKDIATEAGSSASNDKTKTDAIIKHQETSRFKKASEPFVEQLREERQRVIDSMKLKDLKDVKYKDHVDAIDKTTKNIQLLSGEDTDKSNVTLTWE